MAGPSADHALRARVIKHARCADGSHDPDEWFPVSVEIEKARHEAAVAIAVCTSCPVRAQCLALSLRHWDIGQHGVWAAWSPPNVRQCAVSYARTGPAAPCTRS